MRFGKKRREGNQKWTLQKQQNTLHTKARMRFAKKQAILHALPWRYAVRSGEAISALGGHNRFASKTRKRILFRARYNRKENNILKRAEYITHKG